ncbi:MAG: hypothetical protein AB7N76_04355 [Planctomycetota bacterium]
MAQLLLYEDPRALAAYLGGAALLEPELANAACATIELGSPRAGGLLFVEDGLALPEDRTGSTRLLRAAYDRAEGTVVWGRGKQRRQVTLDAARREPRQLAQVVPPIPWERLPETSELLYLVAPGQPFARLITQHLELGLDQLRFAPVQEPGREPVQEPAVGGQRLLVEVPQPSWFLLERWLADHASEAVVYRRLQGSFGPRDVYVEWGYRHPLEPWLRDPEGDGTLLLIDREGTHRTIHRGQLQDVGRALDLDPTAFPTVELTPAPAPERVAVSLRLEGRTAPRDPELWLLPVTDRHRLEELLTQTPEEELKNLLVACVEQPGGERLFCVRELLTGRAPRLLPLGKRAYAPVPGLPDLLVPCGQVIAPPLSNERYKRAFGLRAGALTVLDEVPGDGPRGRIAVTLIPAGAFRGVETIVDFVFDGAARELEQALLAAPFDLGVFAEEDLVPARVQRKEKAPRERPAPEAAPAAPAPEAARPRRDSLLAKLMKPFQRAAAPEESRARAARDQGPDPRREEVEGLQRELTLGAGRPQHWLRLGALLHELGDPVESLRAFENGVWGLEGPEAAAALEELEALLGALSAGARGGGAGETSDLYRRVLAYRREAGARGADADAYRQATEAVYGLLREEEDRLRKKTRWLLWRLVLRETGDAIEGERQREAVLSDLVLRGLEDREVPPFVRRLLLLHYGQRAATGGGASEALAFLQGAEAFAGELPHPAVQSEALSHVAWALSELGQGEQALKLAQRALQLADSKAGAPPHLAWRAEAVARIGAVRERVGGRDEGRADFTRALRTLQAELEAHPSPKSTEGTRARKALVQWFQVVADAWGSERAQDPLVRQALTLLVSLPVTVRSNVLTGARADLERLGLGAEARGQLVELLQPGRLEEARQLCQEMNQNTSAYHNATDAYRTHVQNVMTALGEAQGGQGLAPAEAERVLSLLRGDPDLVDEFAIEPFVLALAALPRPPWDEAEQVAGRFAAQGRLYEARLVRVAALRRLAQLGDRQQGPDRLEEALADAWNQEGDKGKLRIRLITRLVGQVPAFGMRERGLKLLREVQETVRRRVQDDVYCRNEVLMATTLAAAQLGDSRASFELVEQAAHTALQEFRDGQGQRTRHLLFETLDECVRGAARLGETRRGLALVAEVAQAAEGALGASDQGDLGRYFYCGTLIHCGQASLQLGDSEAAAASFASVLRHSQSLSPFDQKDLLLQAGRTAGELEGAQRYRLAGQVLEVAKPIAGKGNLHNAFAMQLTGQLAREMVSGESAFAAALKRWRAAEERAIRDVVAHEAFAP